MPTSANYPAISPSLLLDFANTKALDPRVSFSRPTTATYYDNHTTVVAEQNLLLYSQGAFTNASYWQLVSATATDNSATAPDGTTTASQVTATAINGRIPANSVSQTALVSGATYTMSLYVKLVSGTGTFQFFDGNSFSGTFTATSSWQRFTYTFTSASATTSYRILQILTSGDVLNIWGAQLEQRSSVTAYTATTTAAITNYIPVLLTQQSNEARFDHNPTTRESLGLLIEEQRTNLQTYSSNIVIGDCNTTSNATIAPDGTQTTTLSAPNTTNTTHVLYQLTSLANSTVYTVSVYVKAAGMRYFLINTNGGTGTYGCCFDLQTITASSVGANITSNSITPVGNGWYRCAVTFTSASSGAIYVVYAPLQASSTGYGSYAGDGWNGFYVWGSQFEAGAFSTSFIPTVASQVTRSADSASMTGTNFSSWFNQAQGTLYAETRQVPSVYTGIMALSASNLTRIGLYKFSNNIVYTDAAIVSVNQAAFNLGTVSTQVFYKASFSYQTNNFAGSLNGATAVTGSTGTVPPSLTYLTIGQPVDSTTVTGSQTIKKIAYYPVACTSAQLQGVTTV
jgi:hypothetical protein